MRGRAVQDSFTCPSPAFRTHPHMRFFRSQKWTSILASLLPKQKNFFLKNFSETAARLGPGISEPIPSVWFFRLQFYKKYVIIFKKGKISHENFSTWAFYRKGTVHYKRTEIRLIFEVLFWQSQAKFFWKLRTKFFLKVASKISLENFRCCQVRIFYHERGVHNKRMEMRLTLKGLFWKCGGHFFLFF